MTSRLKDLFDLTGRVAIITGGAGLLGPQHAEAIAEAGGIPVLADVVGEAAASEAKRIAEMFRVPAISWPTNVTLVKEVKSLLEVVLSHFGRVDILINNAASNPKVEEGTDRSWCRLENFPLDQWEAEIAVGLTGAFLCSQIIGSEMARRKRGVIVNVASDLSVVGPDQRIYRKKGLPEDQQPVKPVSYSVVKTALLGLTRYLATYWAEQGLRVNAISPGGVFNDQSDEFVQRLSDLIPLRRMAHRNEYKAAILFLCCDASSYMTGANLVIDGGRSCW